MCVWILGVTGNNSGALTGASMIWVAFQLSPAKISQLNPSYKETHNENPQFGTLGRGWTARTLDRKGNDH